MRPYITKDSELIIKYKLQFFAEGPGGEKTEKPSERKRSKAREEGQVAKSMEITTAFMLIGTFTAIKLLGPYIYDKIILIYRETFSLFNIANGTLDINYAGELLEYIIMSMIEILLPILAVVVVIGLFTNFIQVGWKPSLKTLKPKFNRISPIQGLKRLFSLRSIVELLKSLLKMLIIIVIVYFTLKDKENLILVIYDLNLIEGISLIIDISLDIGIKVGAFFIIVAGIDYAYQRYSLEKQLRMTKQEVKQENKESEGNPEIKSKIRQKMREAAMRRMMQDLPQADVVITNPTHFAVAIKYDSDKSLAPVVIAKGVDFLAAKIKNTAKDNSIEIVENKPLARTLYYTVDVGEEIPEELYQSVAEILAFVYSLKNREGAL